MTWSSTYHSKLGHFSTAVMSLGIYFQFSLPLWFIGIGQYRYSVERYVFNNFHAPFHF
jgi:hypothetical protein